MTMAKEIKLPEGNSPFANLAEINLEDVKEEKKVKSKKTGKEFSFDYISWAWAWSKLHDLYPAATSKVYERPDGRLYWDDGRTCWVKVGVTVEGLEHVEYLPVMDAYNSSIPVQEVTSMDVNKAIQRAVTKAIARHGLGLYVYAGEDLPDEADDDRRAATNRKIGTKRTQPSPAPEEAPAKKAYSPMDEERYMKYVGAYARGEKTPNGRDMLTAWAQVTHAGAPERAQFLSDVENYKINNNLR